MQVAVRSFLTAGIATVGAAAITMAPLQLTLPDLQVTSGHKISVDLAAAVNPIETWVQVVQGAVTNTGALVQQVIADPAPVGAQLVTNQLANLAVLGDTAQTTLQALIAAAEQLPATLQAAGQQLAAGQVVDAFNTVLLYTLQSAIGLIGPIGAFVQIAQNMVQNVANVIGVVPDAILALGLGAAAPVVATLTAGTQTIQEVIDAVGAGDPAAALGAMINAPAALTGAFLNGNPASIFPAGLLSPWVGDAFSSGPIGIALFLRDEVAAALHPVGQQSTAQQAAASESAPVQQAASVEDATAPIAKTPVAAAPEAKRANSRSRFSTHTSPSAALDVQAASPKITPGLSRKAGQEHATKPASGRHDKATARADK